MPTAAVLKYGAIGLALFLAVLAYRLLRQEQRNPRPRQSMLTYIALFMGFSLLLMLGGSLLEAERLHAGQPTTRADVEFAETVSGRWKVVGKDTDWPENGFVARHTYSGFFTIKYSDGLIHLSGDLETFLLDNTSTGSAPFIAEGPLRGLVSAGPYTYDDGKIRGFGSFFFHSDGAGRKAALDCIFRTTTGEAPFGRAHLTLQHE